MAGQADGYIIIDTEIDTNGAKAGSKELEANVRQCISSINGLGDKAKASLNKQANAFSKLNDQYREQEKIVEQLKEKVAELGKQQIPTDEYKEIQAQIESAKTQMDKLIYAQEKFVALGGSEDSKKYKSYQYDIDQLAKTIDDANKELQELEQNGEAFSSALGGETPTYKYKELESELESLSQEIDVAKAKWDELRASNTGGINDEEIKSTLENLDLLYEKYSAVEAKMREKEKFGTDVIKTEPVKEAAAAMEKLAQQEEKLASINDRLKTSYDDVKDSIDSYSNSANNSATKNASDNASKLAKSNEKVADSGKKAADSLKETGSAAGNAKNGIMTLLKYGLGIRSLFVLFNKLRSAVVAGMSNLAQESGSTNSAISMLWGSLERLKNSLATAFAPILTAIAPILSKFIDMLSTAATYVSMFFSMLSGKKTYTRALSVQKDYAASLSDTASSAEDVADATNDAADAADAAAEATEKYLSPLDDLNKMDSKSDSGSGSGGGGKSPGAGGGGGGTGSAPMFTEEQIPNAFLDNLQKVFDLLKKIKDLFMSGFWDGLGDYKPQLAELKKDLASIKKNLVEIFTDPEVVGAAKRFAESVIYNLGVVAGSIASVGLTLAVNLVGGFESYLSRNKDRIKKFLVDVFNVGAEIADEFGLIAKTIAEVFAKTFGTQTAQDLTGNLIGIFASLGGLAVEIFARYERDKMYLAWQPWIDNKDKLVEAINETIAPIQQLAQVIEDFLNDTSDKIIAFYDESVKPFIDDIESGCASILATLLDLYNSYVVPIIDEWGTRLEDLINGPLTDFVDKFLDACAKIIDALQQIWNNVLVPLINWILQNVIPLLAPVVQWLGDAAIDLLGAAVEMANGILDMLGGLIDFLVGVFTGDWKKAFSGAGQIAQGFADTCGAVIEWIGDYILTPFMSLVKKLFSVDWVKYFGVAGIAPQVLCDLIKSIFKTMKNVFIGIMNFIKYAFTGDWRNAWQSVKNIFSSIMSGIGDVVRAPINGIISMVNQAIGAINNLIRGVNRIPHVNIPTIGRIPHLASGAVIPPNQEFLAMLGDQKSGNNIEAPEGLIRKIVREESGKGNGSYTFVAQLDRKVLFKETISEAKLQQIQGGNNPFELSTT
jgi:phage-related protein|nr:MAG TPA: minor tail protein [Caudoviricetes sp.]